MKYGKIVLVMLILVMMISACSGDLFEITRIETDSQGESESQEETDELTTAQEVTESVETLLSGNYDLDDLDEDDLDDSINPADLTTIHLEGDAINFEGNNLVVDGGVATIISSGAYLISGQLTDGQIVVDTQDAETVRLILNGVDILSATSAPIDIRNAEKTVITLAEGSENVVTDGKSYELDENNEPNAAIFSNDDLTINGTGSLAVNANYNYGIASDDDLKIISGNITVISVNDGIKGRDSVTVIDGVLTIKAGGDGIQSNNDVDQSKGNIIVEGGQIEIVTDQDGIQAENLLSISGGEIAMTTGGGSGEITVADMRQGWDQGFNPQVGEMNVEKDTVSAKGLKAGAQLLLSGGSLQMDTADDALHSNDTIQINGGTLDLASGDDGVHADTLLEINGGKVAISQSYEGLESAAITINAGTIQIVSVDDGINGSSGTAIDMMGGRPGIGGFGAGDCELAIHGGTIHVESGGDGLDINGAIEMTGGQVIINGPTSNQNAAFDYMGSFNISGGTFVSVGSAGMAQAPSTASSQYSLMYNFADVQPAGTLFHIETQSGEEVVTFMPTKAYQSVLISSPELQNGETYLIYSGGTITGSAEGGLYFEGAYRAGTEVDSVTISNVITTAGAAGVGLMGGRGGMPGGGFGSAPEGMPQRMAWELDAATQLIFGTLLLDGTSMEITAEQAAELLPLWDSYQSLSSDATTTSEALDELLTHIKSVFTSEQEEVIFAFDLQDMMLWISENGVRNFDFRQYRDTTGSNAISKAFLPNLMDYLEEKSAD